MNIEQIEAELSSLNTKNIIVVRPNFGNKVTHGKEFFLFIMNPTI